MPTHNTFIIADTRRAAPGGKRLTSSPCERLRSAITRAKTLFRSDLDVRTQMLNARHEHLANHKSWVDWHNSQTGFTATQQVFGLKMMIVEAERFQEERGLSFLKNDVLARAAQNLGKTCPADYTRSTVVSTVVCKDVDIIMNMPHGPNVGQLPVGVNRGQLAAKAIMSLPLWVPKNNTQRVSPRSPAVSPSPPIEQPRSSSSLTQRSHPTSTAPKG